MTFTRSIEDMTFGCGIEIYKEDWEYINEEYERLIRERARLLDFIMRCSTTQIEKSIKEKVILNDDIRKELIEERERTKIRVYDVLTNSEWGTVYIKYPDKD